MNTPAKSVVLFVLCAMAISCQIDVKGIKGSGHVTTQTRDIAEPFTGVEVTSGLDVVLEQGPSGVRVEADDNLHQHIHMSVKSGVLKISSDHSSYINVKSRTVHVSAPEITSLKTSGGANLKTRGELSSDKMNIRAKSGSSIKVSVSADNTECDASSGSSIAIRGKALTLSASSSSGSTIDASEMLANDIEVKSSSGSNVTVQPLLKLKAKASSGSSVQYRGNPREVVSDAGYGGSVSKI